jgi:tetratricopeptide (TPR) repeat protein
MPTCSLMPLHRNRLFVGRAVELLALASALHEPGAVAAICGLGGAGKTQIACEFAHRYGQFFPGGVFWVSFGDPTAIPAAVAACGWADHLALQPDFEALPLDRQVRLVLAAWRDPQPRLLIFDNCEDEALLAEWRPPTGGCRVIVTSRRARWCPSLVDLVLPLHGLARAESIALLQAHSPGLSTIDLDAIATELGDLPLALQLAGAYLARLPPGCGPAHYLAELRAKSAQALAHPSLQSDDFSPTGHEQHVGRAFALSYLQLRHDEPVDRQARALLARAAYFAPGEPIPRAILLATANPHMAEAGLARLSHDLSLLETSSDDTLRLHRLVAGFVRAADPDPTAQADAERVVLAEAQRLNEARLPTPMIAFQSHLRAVAEAAAPRADAMAAELCAELGWHLMLLGSHDEAHRHIAHSLAMREAAFGPDHPETAKSLSLLGLAYQFQGTFMSARPCYEQALAIREHTLGADHIETATDCNNLGYLLFHLDEYASARSYLWRALLIRSRTVGLKDAGTARTLSNLGYVLMHSGDHAAARRYLKLALAIREQVLPMNHPATAQTLNNLGEALFAQGDYDGARRYHERALAMRDAVFGANQWHAAESMRNLALVLRAQGDFAAARSYLERAVTICEATLGERHIETAWKLESMGELLLGQGEIAAAQAYLSRALAVYTELLNEGHHKIASVRGMLARIDDQTG